MPDETGAVTPIDIAQLRDEAVAIKTFDMQSGGAMTETLREVRRRGRAALAMMSRGCASPLQQGRAEAVAWFLTNAGFMMHDAGRNSEAKQTWFNAEAIARESGRYSLIARTLSQRARMELALGHLAMPHGRAAAGEHFDSAVGLIEHAINRDERGELSGTELAALYALLARGYANMGDERFIAASRRAEIYWFAESRSWDLNNRPWWSHFDEPHLKGDLASAARVAAISHGFDVASASAALYEEAADAQQSQNRRSAVLNLASLSLLEAVRRDLDRAVWFGKRAVEGARHVKSQRVTDHFADLTDALKPNRARGDVAELIGSIRSLVAA